MSAVDYMKVYKNLAVKLSNDEVQNASIDKYLNNAVNPRGKSAWDASDLLLSEMIDETHTNWKAIQFNIDGAVIQQKTIRRVFTGKGSPNEVKTALRMAHRYGFITNSNKPRKGSKSLKEYTDAYCGLDCNGFVGNYLGMDSTTSISGYGEQRLRLSKVDDIKANTALVWYDPAQSDPWRHIAIIDSIVQSGDPLKFRVVQSAGPNAENGVRDDVWSKTAAEILKDGNKNLYYSFVLAPYFSDKTQVFFCAPPATGDSND